jgi:hypothetical protein
MDLPRLYLLTWYIKNICMFTNCIWGNKTFRWNTVAEGATGSCNLRIFQVGTRMPTVSGREGQHLVPLKIFINTKHRSDDAWYAVSANLIFSLCCKRIFLTLKKSIVTKGYKCNSNNNNTLHCRITEFPIVHFRPSIAPYVLDINNVLEIFRLAPSIIVLHEERENKFRAHINQ